MMDTGGVGGVGDTGAASTAATDAAIANSGVLAANSTRLDAAVLADDFTRSLSTMMTDSGLAANAQGTSTVNGAAQGVVSAAQSTGQLLGS